jgi:hypothetical protein
VASGVCCGRVQGQEMVRVALLEESFAVIEPFDVVIRSGFCGSQHFVLIILDRVLLLQSECRVIGVV